MPRSALSGVGRGPRSRLDQSKATEPPAAGTERDGVTYGETTTLGPEATKAAKSSTSKTSTPAEG